MSGFASAALSITMIAAFMLVVGGIALIRRGERQRAVLMVVAAAVLAANVLIWTV